MWWNKRLWGKYFAGVRETDKDAVLVHYEEECFWAGSLTLSWERYLSYRNQSIDLPCKSMDRFLYDRDLRHERIKDALTYLKHGLVMMLFREHLGVEYMGVKDGSSKWNQFRVHIFAKFVSKLIAKYACYFYRA